MKTSNYQLAIFGTSGDENYDPVEEEYRWTLVDSMLGMFANTIGTGVLNGLSVQPTTTYDWGGTSLLKFMPGVVMTPGYTTGFIVGVVESEQGDTGVDVSAYLSATDYYVYAQANANSALNQSIDLEVGQTLPVTGVELARFNTDASGVLTMASTSGLRNMMLTTTGRTAITTHQHTGTTGQAAKIDLSTEVRGVLPLDNLPIDIPASKLSGYVPIPSISLSHNYLQDRGIYTHPQLEVLYNLAEANASQYEPLGLVNCLNRLQFTLGLLEYTGTYSAIRLIYNEKPFSPGYTPTYFVNPTYTTATANATYHRYQGVTGTTLTPTESWFTQWGGPTATLSNIIQYTYDDPSIITTIYTNNVAIVGATELANEYVTVAIAGGIYSTSAGTIVLRYDAVAPVDYTNLVLDMEIPSGTSVLVEVNGHDGDDMPISWTEVDTYTSTLTNSTVALSSITNVRYLDIRLTLQTDLAHVTVSPKLNIVSANWIKSMSVADSYIYTTPISLSSALSKLLVVSNETTTTNTSVDYRVCATLGHSWASCVPLKANAWSQELPNTSEFVLVAKLSSGSLTDVPYINSFNMQFHDENNDLYQVAL